MKPRAVTDPDWTPTAANVNALPEPLRAYIRDLETNADPAGTIRDNHVLRENAAAMLVKLEEGPRGIMAVIDGARQSLTAIMSGVTAMQDMSAEAFAEGESRDIFNVVVEAAKKLEEHFEKTIAETKARLRKQYEQPKRGGEWTTLRNEIASERYTVGGTYEYMPSDHVRAGSSPEEAGIFVLPRPAPLTGPVDVVFLDRPGQTSGRGVIGRDEKVRTVTL